jgi:hypothetical protein
VGFALKKKSHAKGVACFVKFSSGPNVPYGEFFGIWMGSLAEEAAIGHKSLLISE